MVYILHIDTSGETGVVMLAADGKVLSQRTNTDSRNHASVINIYIDEVVKDAGISLKELSAIAVCGGPGSYTGLRIGLSTAKGLCYALDKPLLQHNKLLLLTVNQHYKFLSTYEFYLSVLPARDKEYFYSIYNNQLKSIVEPRHIFEDELGKILDETVYKTLLTGSINEQLATNENINTIINQTVEINSWAQYAFERYNCNEIVSLSNSEPFYLKEVYTHKPKNTN
jgi:tRNA threonylcarbamoyladenosine biosynthesis protein TsaB